jgi:thiosulfate reductase cytochrome b subunit
MTPFLYFSNAFGVLQYALLLHEQSSYVLSSCYLNWLLSFLTNRRSCVRSAGILTYVAFCRAVRRTPNVSFRAFAFKHFY